jgi:hypothetical protein
VKKRYIIAVGCALLPACAFAQGTFTVRLNQNRYAVQPGETFRVSALIDPVPAGGLFSFGVRILFEPADAQIASDQAIVIPAPLDFNGPAGVGALKVIVQGSAAVKGSVDPVLLPPRGYSDPILASFEITDISLAPGRSYPLKLELFRTLGPTESVFVSGNGLPLDGNLAFGMATVEVVPEPRVLSLVLVSGMIGLLARTFHSRSAELNFIRLARNSRELRLNVSRSPRQAADKVLRDIECVCEELHPDPCPTDVVLRCPVAGLSPERSNVNSRGCKPTGRRSRKDSDSERVEQRLLTALSSTPSGSSVPRSPTRGFHPRLFTFIPSGDSNSSRILNSIAVHACPVEGRGKSGHAPAPDCAFTALTGLAVKIVRQCGEAGPPPPSPNGERIPRNSSPFEPLDRTAKVAGGVLTVPQEGRRFCLIPGGLRTARPTFRFMGRASVNDFVHGPTYPRQAGSAALLWS